MNEIMHALLRIVTGFLFWQQGAAKMLGWFGGLGGSGEPAAITSEFGIAGVIEFFGGILIILGVKTRWVAFVLAGQMAVAFFWKHVPTALWPIMNGGEKAVLFCFIFLFLWSAGAGRWSLDDAVEKGRA